MALGGAASSSDELSEELLLFLAFAAGGGCTVFTVHLLASSSELLSLDEDWPFFAGVFVVVATALPLVTRLAGVDFAFVSESELDSELLSGAVLAAAACCAAF